MADEEHSPKSIMIKPALHEFGLTDSEYVSYKAAPKKIETRFMQVGAILGSLAGFFLAYDNFELINILLHIWCGLIIGSISFALLNVILGDLVISRHKLHSRISAYEVALLSYQRTRQEHWRSLDGKDFEKELGNLFSSQGYLVEFTPSTGDQGSDLVLRKGGIKTIVQCKAHSKPVGPAVARDLYGTLVASRADLAILASTSGFTKGVHLFAKGKRMQLLSLNDIILLSEQLEEL
jgi:restriction system protein